MSTMHIQIVSVDIGQGKTKTNKPYEFIDLVFKNKSFQDKIENKKIMPFGNKEVFDILRTAEKGDFYYVSREKNDAGYWDWTKIEEHPPEESTPKNNVATPKQSYDQRDDQRQLYIIRQSSLTNAVNTLTSGIDPTEVKKTALVYIDFVLGVDNKFNNIETSFDDDYID